MANLERQPCACGCGGYPIKPASKYVKGHGRRGVRRDTGPCSCGCDEQAVRCNGCRKMLHLSAFGKQAGALLGVRSRCKLCASERAAQWNDANLDRVLETRLRRVFGITLADYRALEDEQGGVCAICGRPPAITLGKLSPRREARRQGRQRRPQLVVDHDHATGKIRGLLCVHCNRGIGFLQDDPDIVRFALKYLEERP